MLLLYIDVRHELSQFFPIETYNMDFIHSINSTVTSIIIPDWTCYDIDYTIFDFSRFTLLESIEIGDNCFGSVQTFKIDGLNRLKTITIGKRSFTQHKNDDEENDELYSFHLLNCESLESIQISIFSFTGFGGEFELKNLPQLQSIQIGSIGNASYNFYRSSFVIRGIELILNI